MKKHAIFLRGNIRTWNYIKKDIIAFFDTFHNKPDWYVCFWDSDTSTISKVSDDFKDSNLKFLKFETDETYEKFDTTLVQGCYIGGWNAHTFPDTLQPYWRLAYLDQILSMAKRKYEIENNIQYHSVFFARPDILYRTTHEYEQYMPLLNSLHPMEITNLHPANSREGKRHIGNRYDNHLSSDIFIVAGNIAADIFSTRFIDVEYTDGSLKRFINWDVHQVISMVKTKYQLFELSETQRTDMITVYTDVIRPNKLSMEEWNMIPRSTRAEICKNSSIDPYDYDLYIT